MSTRSPLEYLCEQREAAIGKKDPSANYCTFATLEEQGTTQVRTRTLVVRDVSADSCLLFVNRLAKKNLLSLSDVSAEALFFYPSLMSQFRLRGCLSLMDSSDLEKHWHHKPYESKLLDHYYARYQNQSSVLPDRASLEHAMAELKSLFPNPEKVPYIENALGLIITADYLEIWQAHVSGVHDRSLFTKQGAKWQEQVLVP